MKPGELYKPVGFDCMLLCVAPETFTVEAGESPFLHSPLDGKIHFPTGETPPMHRAWHWSDLVTPAQAEEYPDRTVLMAAVFLRLFPLLGAEYDAILDKSKDPFDMWYYELHFRPETEPIPLADIILGGRKSRKKPKSI